MNELTRRHFLQTTLGMFAAMGTATASRSYRPKPLLAFSTLGCPKWSLETSLDAAAKNGYDGIEIRGIAGVLDLTKSPAFDSAEHVASSRRLAADKGVKIINLGASTQLHHADAATRQRHLDEAKRFITLADQLACPYVRVFPNDIPKNEERRPTIDRITQGLTELADYAKGSQVSILLETHGDGVQPNELVGMMQAVKSPKVGLIWDVFNMWSVTKEPPAQAYATLKPYIRHVHIKDAKLVNGAYHYVPLGQGESPIFDAITALADGGYKGYYSLEWEKMWHPDLEEPEVVFPQYPKIFNQFYASGNKPGQSK
ncbi:sugar phosphate isomerase/epimerase family protein [Spirosoma oryzicola]|uniref:sugar phosphate isomerase/epimerase family protein n=1 Tax=Spirosoma oryzicola TaxID=2898794 RepID=UPI001E330ECA|nr:sugar phosphate isomerase/epimerase family protein [Spirosoma oryzicola]UHG91947.1 sugar phosphate isomerase/epimerase [Spirosoma oryzicola]